MILLLLVVIVGGNGDLVCLAEDGECSPERSLIIDGQVLTPGVAPFVVALMQCTTTGGTRYCGKFCSGSLIAPDVVLTAGHCVRDASSPFGQNIPPVALAGIFVMAGSVDIYNQPGPLIQAASLVDHGYGLNVRYKFDKDVGLVFLQSCFTIVPGVVETIPVATLATEPVWEDTAADCATQSVQTFGYGIMSNLPGQIAKDDGTLKAITTLIHGPTTCSDAYVAATFASSGTSLSLLNEPQYALIKTYYYSLFVPEYHLCAGGDRPDGAAACFGDSGGPVVSNMTVVGVTSFGASGFCGLGPDFSARTASQADWIAAQLTARASLCNASVENSFASYPPESLSNFSSSFLATRCTDVSNPWQCDSGSCIPEADVCNGTPNCGTGDTSDEGSPFCPTRRLEQESSELDDLIAVYLEKKAALSLAETDAAPSVVVVGSLTVDLRVPPMDVGSFTDASGRIDTPKTGVVASGAACGSVNKNLTNMISAEKDAPGPNSQNTDDFQTACDLISACEKQTEYSSSATLDSFCTDFNTYVDQAAIATTLALSFNTTYNLSCAVPWDGILPTNSPTAPPAKSSGIFFSAITIMILLSI